MAGIDRGVGEGLSSAVGMLAFWDRLLPLLAPVSVISACHKLNSHDPRSNQIFSGCMYTFTVQPITQSGLLSYQLVHDISRGDNAQRLSMLRSSVSHQRHFDFPVAENTERSLAADIRREHRETT
jgi:hypothetical protein